MNNSLTNMLQGVSVRVMKTILILTILLLILTMGSCANSHKNTNNMEEKYKYDSLDCSKGDFDYHDCMLERGWQHDDHYYGAPLNNPYQHQIPGHGK